MRTLLVLAALTALGTLLRFRGLGEWTLEGDEIHTLRDSLRTSWLTGPKPLLFFLNHHLIGSWRPFDEFGLRLIPALAGVAAIPTMYLAGRLLVSPRVGLFAAFAVGFHPWHIYWSQFGRYYSLVFLAATFFPAAAYRAVADRSVRWMLAGLLGFMIAALAHPSAALLLGGVGVWVGWSFVRDRQLGGRRLVITLGVGAALLVALLVQFTPVWLRWYRMGQDWGHQGLVLVLSFADGMTLPFLAFAVGGLAVEVARGRVRVDPVFLIALIGLPTLALFVLSYVVSVSNSYLFATAPFYFLAVAAFFDRLAALSGPAGKSVVATCALVLLAGWAPRLWSHQLDGSRPHMRAAAQYVQARGRAGDHVFADQWRVVDHYLPEFSVVPFDRDPARLRTVTAGDMRQELWLVTVRRWRGGFNDLDLGEASRWVAAHCLLEHVFATSRLDYKQDEVQVYRCGSRPVSDWSNTR